MSVKSYRDLIVWSKSMELVECIYRLTSTFPREEIYGLTNQLRRAAISIPSNIAEGQGRQSTREFLNFLSIARGSLFEVETQVLVANRLQYLQAAQRDNVLSTTQEIGKLLNGLMKSLRARNRPND